MRTQAVIRTLSARLTHENLRQETSSIYKKCCTMSWGFNWD